jgi:hypothetical protein
VLIVLLAACWSLVPAVVCARRLYKLNGWRGWGAVLGLVFGPLGVAALNVYSTLLYRAVIAEHLHPRRRSSARHTARGDWQPTPPGFVFSVRGDLLSLACLWAAAFLGVALFANSTAHQPGGTDISGSRQTQTPASATPAASNAAPATTGIPVALGSDRGAAQAFDRRTGGPATDEPGHMAVLGATPGGVSGQVEGAQATTTAATQTASPAQPADGNTAPPTNTPAPTPEPSAPPKPTATAAAAGSVELVRLVLPPGVRAHGTVSGAGSTTTLAITCADCSYEQANERLRAASVRANLKAAGIRVVVVVSRQDSWTFIL